MNYNVLKAFLLLAVSIPLFAQESTTVITHTYAPINGIAVNGTLTIAVRTEFQTFDGYNIPVTTQTIPITNGAFTVTLPPNAGSTPPSGYYVTYQLNGGNPTTVIWSVPQSMTPVDSFSITVTGIPPYTVEGATLGQCLVWGGAAWIPSNCSNSINGNAVATADALAVAPTPCASGKAANGIDVHGNSTGCITLAPSATTDTTDADNISSGTLAGARLPNPSSTVLGGVESAASVTHQYLTGITTSGVPTAAQPSASDVTGLATSATTDTTNASNITSGTLASARLPVPTLSAIGGVEAIAAVTHQFLTSISTSGIPVLAQPAAADVSGLAASATTDTTNASNISSGTLGSARLPVPSATTLGGIESYAGVTHQFVSSITTAGVPVSTQPVAADVSGLATSATVDTTNAANITTGTLAGARLPNPSSTVLGGIESAAAVTHQFLTSISTSGVPALAQPAASDVSGLAPSATTDTTNASNISSGTLAAARLPNPSAGALGGTESLLATTHFFMTGITTSGVPTSAQPAAADVSGLAASATTDTTNASNITSGTLAAARLPNPSATTLGGTESIAAVTHQFLTSISTSGVPVLAQPAAADVSGLAASATTDTTNAGNITSGTLAGARLPNPSATTLGGIESIAAVTHQFISSISILGVPSLTQPAAADVTGLAASATTDTTNASNISSGTLAAARLPNPSATTLGGTESYAAITHQFLTTISTSGVISSAQPAAADISGLAASATTDTTNASNISSGTLAVARGGTGETSLTGIRKANGASADTAAVGGTDFTVSVAGTSGQISASNASGAITLSLANPLTLASGPSVDSSGNVTGFGSGGFSATVTAGAFTATSTTTDGAYAWCQHLTPFNCINIGMPSISSTFQFNWPDVEANDVVVTNNSLATLTGKRLNHLVGSTAAPSCTPGAAAGSGATCSITSGTDMSWEVSLTTAGSPTTTGTLFTIGNVVAYGAAPQCTHPEPTNAAAAGLSITSYPFYVQSSSSGSNLVWNASGTALTVNTFTWDVVCTG